MRQLFVLKSAGRTLAAEHSRCTMKLSVCLQLCADSPDVVPRFICCVDCLKFYIGKFYDALKRCQLNFSPPPFIYSIIFELYFSLLPKIIPIIFTNSNFPHSVFTVAIFHLQVFEIKFTLGHFINQDV